MPYTCTTLQVPCLRKSRVGFLPAPGKLTLLTQQSCSSNFSFKIRIGLAFSYRKSIPAIPLYLMNGKRLVAQSSSLLRPSERTSVNAEERERLTASIVSSNARRHPIDLGSLESPKLNGHGSYPLGVPDADSAAAPTNIDVSARDPRDEAPFQPSPFVSQPASPYTLNPPIDFDGLSWPSESWLE